MHTGNQDVEREQIAAAAHSQVEHDSTIYAGGFATGYRAGYKDGKAGSVNLADSLAEALNNDAAGSARARYDAAWTELIAAGKQLTAVLRPCREEIESAEVDLEDRSCFADLWDGAVIAQVQSQRDYFDLNIEPPTPEWSAQK